MWSTLIMTLPTQPNAVRLRIWRNLKALGCAALRDGDTLARLGGDEFACLLQGMADAAPLRQLCAKLLEAVSRPMKVADLQLLVCPSIGVAMCPQHGTTAKDLMACADAAMYAAKRERRGFAFYGEVA